MPPRVRAEKLWGLGSPRVQTGVMMTTIACTTEDSLQTVAQLNAEITRRVDVLGQELHDCPMGQDMQSGVVHPDWARAAP
jgi:hypothetical protein